ncbi:MAG: CAP domain-containing protein, partial [Verrucomicrobiales bacterium]|nr:CAP domain-containing protein [Verrucomicrobiales bacterium]
MRARFWGLFASAIVAMPSSEAVVPSSETLDLGEAPLPSERARRDAGRPLAPASANDGFRVDVSRREQVRNFYNTVFVSSEGIDEGWTGTYDGCVEGTTTAEFKDAVLRRINYYRAMAGLPAGVVWDAGYSAKAQKAALIMSAQNGLSHFPPATWACYTAEGSEAAANSNIALGNSGPGAIDGYMEDHGAGNKPVGHRRWLLYPQTRVMGTGDVPGGGGRRPANAVWVFDGKFGTSRPETREAYVAWP